MAHELTSSLVQQKWKRMVLKTNKPKTKATKQCLTTVAGTIKRIKKENMTFDPHTYFKLYKSNAQLSEALELPNYSPVHCRILVI